MFYLVQYPNETYGIYPQCRISKENGTACLVKHKGSKYEAIIMKKNDSIKILEQIKNNYEFLKESRRENKKHLLDINDSHTGIHTAIEVDRSSITDSNYSLSDIHHCPSSSTFSEEETSQPIFLSSYPTEPVESSNEEKMSEKNAFGDNVIRLSGIADHNPSTIVCSEDKGSQTTLKDIFSGSRTGSVDFNKTSEKNEIENNLNRTMQNNDRKIVITSDILVEKGHTYLSECSTDDSELLFDYDFKTRRGNKYEHNNVPNDELVETVNSISDSLISGNTDESTRNLNGFEINTSTCHYENITNSPKKSDTLVNETFIVSFDCQPGDIIDLSSSQIITSICSAPLESSTPDKHNMVSSYNSQHEIDEDLSKEKSNQSSDSEYIPDDHDTPEPEHLNLNITNQEIPNEDETFLQNVSFSLNKTGLRPCDEDQMYVQKSRGRNGDQKSNFCLYCLKKQRKFARHLELKHRNEDDVKKCMVLPKGCQERRQIIGIIRKKGNYIFNTDNNYNDGELIVSRRPNAEINRDANHYKACGNCKAFFSKMSLRAHYSVCTKTSSAKTRNIMVLSKRVMGRIHARATEVVRKELFPPLREDNIIKIIRYDELVIIYANKMVEKYKQQRHFEMIRQRIRLLGRFLTTIRRTNSEVTDMTSVYDPKFIDNTIEAINLEAKLNNSDFTYQTPTVASTLGTLLKQLGKILINECIKQHQEDKQKHVENYLKLFNEEISIGINRLVAESQFQQQRRKTVRLPPQEDITKLNKYLVSIRNKSFMELRMKFSADTWIKLAETTLTSIQLFNRRRAGEVERILIDDFLAFQNVDEKTDRDLFLSLSKASQELARKYVRFAIRGKLNRNVPVLLDNEMLECVQLVLKHRKEAGVPDNNPYVFGIHSNKKMFLKHLSACSLMRRFAEECGAEYPDRLRGTELRKHVATTCINLNLSENEVSDLANFMGHRESIHKNFYRQPLISREIVKMSKLLEIAQGTRHQQPESGSESSDEEVASTSCQVPKTSVRKRSTSPFGSVKRKRWSDKEKEVVLTAYADHISNRTLPSLANIQNLIVSNPCLKNRHSAQIKTWINNQFKKM